MATRMQQRRGTAAQWISTNSGQGPVLNAGEIGFESDTNKFKIGDGINHWVSLVYFTDAASALAAINAVIDAAPAALNTLNELAAAINDDPSFFTTIATNLSNHESDTTNVHGIADTSLLATKSYADTAEADAITAAGTAADTKISNAVAALTKSSVGLSNVDNTSDANKPVSTATQTALDLKAPKADPTFTGTVSGVTKAHVGLGNVDNTSDADKPVSTAQATAIATAKSEAISDATSQVNAVIAGAPAALNTLDELAAALGDDANFASTLTTSLSAKAPLASPTFTGTVSGVTATHVGLGNVDNTSDANKPVSTATQTALDAKASNTDLSDHTSATTNVHGIANTADLATQDYVNDQIASSEDSYPDLVGNGLDWNGVDGTFEIDTAVTVDLATAQTLTNKTLTSPVINTPTGITKSDVGLGDVDNTSDSAKPVSTATQAELDLKAPLANPTFTGTVAGITKSMVGLANVDNTTDANKPVSTATQTALDLKANLDSPTFTGTVTLPANTISQSMMGDDSVGTNEIGGLAVTTEKIAALAVTEGKIADGAVTSAKIADGTIVNADINASAAIAQSKIADLTTDLAAKAPLASPTFTGTTTTDDLVVDGDFTVNGTNFAASATSITIEDNIVQIAHQNPANTVDLGLVVGYNDGTAKHAGLVKDTSANTWKLFKGVTTEPATTVDFTEGSLDDLAVAGLTASSLTVGDVSNTEIGYLNGVTSAIQTQLDDKAVYPTQTGNDGKFLKTDGTSASWDSVPVTSPATSTAVGTVFGNTVTTYNNTAVGYQALNAVTTGAANVAMGHQALYSLTTAQKNTAIGYSSLNQTTTGNYNTAIGYNTLVYNTVGYYNEAIGYGALESNTTGYYNIGVGGASLSFNTTGVKNIAVGYGSLRRNVTGANNTAIGYYSGIGTSWGGDDLTGSNNIYIGYQSEGSSLTVSNEITLGNSSNTIFRVPGINLKHSGSTTTVSANTATTVSTTALANFTTMEYIVSIKQGSKIRSSKVLVQTDGTAVDSVEHSILETGGSIAGINVTAAVSSTNCILTVTITDAATTNATVKVMNTII